MPSQITHLAIAKRYLEKHPQTIFDVQAFLDGNILPDLAADKANAHCGVRTEMHDLVKRNREKVDPVKFAMTHDMHDDLNKGQYLHLYVDYQFYNVFLLEYFKNITIEQSAIDMYEVTRRDDRYLEKKYQVAYSDSTLHEELQKINDLWDKENAELRCNPAYKFAFPYKTEELDAFIEEISEIVIPQV